MRLKQAVRGEEISLRKVAVNATKSATSGLENPGKAARFLRKEVKVFLPSAS
jgi:hypothetical protein